MLIETNNIIGVGTGRIVVDNLDGTVTKIPYGELGEKQNLKEYELSKNKPYVAKIKLKDGFSVQEKLTDLITVPHKYKKTKQILRYLNKINPNYNFSELIKYRLGNRIQIGKDKSGIYKYFDYERVKYYEK